MSIGSSNRRLEDAVNGGAEARNSTITFMEF
jgi:hypothetical protein